MKMTETMAIMLLWHFLDDYFQDLYFNFSEDVKFALGSNPKHNRRI